MIIEKKTQTPEVSHEYFEIKDIEIVKDVDGNDVQIPKLIETVSKNQVEVRIAQRNTQIESLQAQNTKDEEILETINQL